MAVMAGKNRSAQGASIVRQAIVGQEQNVAPTLLNSTVMVIVIAQAVKLTMQVVIKAAGHGIAARRAGFLVFT